MQIVPYFEQDVIDQKDGMQVKNFERGYQYFCAGFMAVAENR